MQKVSDWITKILAYILIILMALMVLDVSWQVITRFIMKNPSSFTEELARFLLIWIGVLGASYAYKTNAHLGIDILTYRLTGVKKKISQITVASLVMLFAIFIMVIGGMRLVQLTFTLNQLSAAMEIKMGFIYLVIPLSGILTIFYSIGFIIDAIKENAVGQSNQ